MPSTLDGTPPHRPAVRVLRPEERASRAGAAFERVAVVGLLRERVQMPLLLALDLRLREGRVADDVGRRSRARDRGCASGPRRRPACSRAPRSAAIAVPRSPIADSICSAPRVAVPRGSTAAVRNAVPALPGGSAMEPARVTSVHGDLGQLGPRRRRRPRGRWRASRVSTSRRAERPVRARGPASAARSSAASVGRPDFSGWNRTRRRSGVSSYCATVFWTSAAEALR